MDKSHELKPRPGVIVVHSKLLPQPPGTKSRAQLPRGLEEQNPSGIGWRYLLVSLLAVALAIGVLIGRFLVP